MNEKQHNILLLIILLAISALTVITALRYQGSTLTYLFFSLTSTILLISGIKKDSIFFDTFFGIFFWLGFWLKFSIRTSFFNMTFSEPIGFYNGDIYQIDKALLISSVAFLGFILASGARQYFHLFTYVAKPNTKSKFELKFLEGFYLKNRLGILLCFLLFSIAISVLNFQFGIYQKGLPALTTLPFGLNKIITWLILFGLSSIASFFIFYDIKNNKQGIASSILYLLDCLFTNISLLSRGFILNGSSLIFAHYFEALRKRNKIQHYFSRVILYFVFLVMFISSIVIVNYFRISKFNTDQKNKIETSIQDSFSEAARNTKVLFIDRWVGIEGVISIAAYQNTGWMLWKEAWKEKFKDNGTSFYDLNLINSPYKNQNLEKHHFVSLPGIVAFGFYPGSFIFLFIFCFLMGFLALGLEYFAYYFSGGNYFLSSLIGQIIAYRFSNFGYVPAQSYLLFGTIVLNVVIFVTFNKILKINEKL